MIDFLNNNIELVIMIPSAIIIWLLFKAYKRHKHCIKSPYIMKLARMECRIFIIMEWAAMLFLGLRFIGSAVKLISKL